MLSNILYITEISQCTVANNMPPCTRPTLNAIALVLCGNGLSSMRKISNTSHDIRHKITTWSRTAKSPEHVW